MHIFLLIFCGHKPEIILKNGLQGVMCAVVKKHQILCPTQKWAQKIFGHIGYSSRFAGWCGHRAAILNDYCCKQRKKA